MNKEDNKTPMPEQIMFIVWKWDELTAINEKIKGKEEKYLSEIAQGTTGTFFTEYAVVNSDLCPNPKIIASYIYNTEETRPILYTLLEKYAVNNNEIMVFLHRGDYYEEEDVKLLLEHFKDRVQSCFLFADGRDYIYHQTQKAGFLDDAGGFRVGIDKDTKEYVCTFREGKVLQPYFDRVWEYYKIEFEIKVFQLKEDLMDIWFPFLLPGQPDTISRNTLVSVIQQNNERLLWLRLKSFINRFEEELKGLDEINDFDRINAIEKEIKQLKALEKSSKTSYVFDDCINNLEHHRQNERTFVADAYSEARQTLERLLFDENTTEISTADIRQLVEELNYLVKVIPGELD